MRYFAKSRISAGTAFVFRKEQKWLFVLQKN